MNKLTKVGLSALCGSLASVAANAGTMEVLGGATATYTSNSKQVTGNPIGMNSALTFKGSGELDNGTAFTLTVTGADQMGYTSGNINIATPSMGSFNINSRTGGNGIGGHDDKMPTAWEESWGHGMGSGFDFQKGVASSMNIGWTSPSFMGTTLKLAVAPGQKNAAFINDKGVGGDSANGGAYDALIEIKPSFGVDALSGLTIWAGGSETEQTGTGPGGKAKGDHQEVNAGFTFAYGPVTVGFQKMGEFTGSQTAGNTEYYDNEAFGISFNVSDNLSISYGEFESKRHKVGSGTTNKSVTGTTESFQIAYTMGGMSLKLAEGEVSNASYSTASANDHDGRTIALSLAF
jgi:hypothetical protein